MRAFAPETPKDRFDVYRFFNGLSEEAKEGIDRRHLRVPLVKTFLLEHVASKNGVDARSPDSIFSHMGLQVARIDDSFMSLRGEVTDPDTQKPVLQTTGFLEQYDERFFAYYTSEDATNARKRVSRWIQSPDLDFTWFSSPFLQVLWSDDISKRGDDRFCKLVFRHESIFDMPEDFARTEEEVEEDADESSEGEEEGNGDDTTDHERRKARFEMGDRIGSISRSLSVLQENYDPLNALYALRLPSRSGRGGHDLYQAGQITNRSDSFEDHRNTVRYLYRLYKSVLGFTEDCAWHQVKPEQSLNLGTRGVPLIVRFSERLSDPTFDRWVEMAFKKTNRFKLWGIPRHLGPHKVHIYGADRHLWQPIHLELTPAGLTAILPHGTCGNTFHRLIANIQHYISPKIRAWVGAEPFEKIVRQWPADAGVFNEN